MGTIDSPRITRHPSATAMWTLLAWGLGTWPAASAVWPPVLAPDHRSSLGLALGGALWAVALKLRPLWGATGALTLIAAAVVGAAATVPTVGRAPILVTWVLVTVAFAALVEWRPTPGWPQRSGAQAWFALPFVLAACITWRATSSLPPTLALAFVGLAVVEWTGRRSSRADALGDRCASAARLVVDRCSSSGRRAASATGVATVGRYLHGRWQWWRTWLATPVTRRDGWLLAAIVTGFLLRSVWALTMTTTTVEWYAQWNLRFAEQFAAFQTPSYYGVKTAYWPVGYGATLAPLQWLSDRTSWFGIHAAASMLNVVVATVTIGLVAALARTWFGARARNPAAWLMAIAPGHIYATSATVSETLATAVAVLVTLAISILVKHLGRRREFAPLFVVGLGIGYAALLKDFGIFLLLVPALALRATNRSWRGAARATGAAALGAAVLLVPWGIRNAVQVGVWTPLSTVTADSLCYTTYEVDWLQFIAAGGAESMSREMLEDCNRNSPLDNPAASDVAAAPVDRFRSEGPDEAKWYRSEVSEFLSWVVQNPTYLPTIAPLRLYTTVGNDAEGGLTLAAQSGEVELAGPLAMSVFRDAANGWYYVVAGLTLLALLRLPVVRAAIPLWAIPLFLALYPILGPRALSRHFFIAYPFLVVMAAAAVAAIHATTRDQSREPGTEP